MLAAISGHLGLYIRGGPNTNGWHTRQAFPVSRAGCEVLCPLKRHTLEYLVIIIITVYVFCQFAWKQLWKSLFFFGEIVLQPASTHKNTSNYLTTCMQPKNVRSMFVNHKTYNGETKRASAMVHAWKICFIAVALDSRALCVLYLLGLWKNDTGKSPVQCKWQLVFICCSLPG